MTNPSSHHRSRIALTMGDPAGIGPEIVVGALAGGLHRDDAEVVVVGDLARLVTAAGILGVEPHFEGIATIGQHRVDEASIPVLQTESLPFDLPFGRVAAAAGAASFAYVRTCIDLALSGAVDAIVTAPIHKEAWRAAGVPYPDHTSALATLTAAPRHAMMLANDELRTVLVTTHLPLAAALAEITEQRVLGVIELAHGEMLALGIENPRIAVAGVNPHAGEAGMFGDEETRAIGPAVQAARKAGIDASGPHPPDTVFMRARKGEFDIVVAQYHDQGLIPIKLGGIDDGVNITLGLPFVRTSVDHGTAFDIAGTGQASSDSLYSAINYALRLVRLRRDRVQPLTPGLLPTTTPELL
jgi:4-hydroxythreonine-4-phosphate dehydrogenase